jgi:hypothetical protein
MSRAADRPTASPGEIPEPEPHRGPCDSPAGAAVIGALEQQSSIFAGHGGTPIPGPAEGMETR